MLNNLKRMLFTQESTEHYMGILFTGMTVSSFLGLMAFVSTSITRWHFNPPIHETEALHNSFEDHHYLVEWDEHGTTAAEASETTVSSLGCDNLCDIVLSFASKQPVYLSYHEHT